MNALLKSSSSFSVYAVVLLLVHSVLSLPEQGNWDAVFDEKNDMQSFVKTMFNQSTVHLRINCTSDNKNLKLAIGWVLRLSPCAEEYVGLEKNTVERYYNDPGINQISGIYYEEATFQSSKNEIVKCSEAYMHSLKDFSSKDFTRVPFSVPESSEIPHTKRSKRAAVIPSPTKSVNVSRKVAGNKPVGRIATSWSGGVYILIVRVLCINIEKNGKCEFHAKVNVRMTSNYGYLSAIEWPFMIFYGVMSLLYLFLGLIWLVLCACHWRDLLRVQFWIGAVIVLGMLEKACFYYEYQKINATGVPFKSVVIFAELVSCVKRTLARLLLMVVCIGYGIVKPRLGTALTKVVSIGVIYLVFALIEGCIRVLRPLFDASHILLYANVPITVVDVVILWWTFTYLIHTMRQMRVRRNTVKFNLYRHFSNILILVTIVSLIFMAWSLYDHKIPMCKKNWQEMWLDEAFWRILFSVILIVIMFLWRPSKNNQRYAYSPVLDADDDDDEDVLMDNMTSGEMKKKTKDGSSKSKKAPTTDDDLKWIEENIPAATAEHMFPLVESDEELRASSRDALSKMD